MFRNIFDGPGWIIILAVVVLLFGATRLPALARSIGQSTKIFREEMKTDKPADGAATTTPAETTPAQNTAAPAPTATTTAPTSTASSTESSGTPPKP